MKSLEQEITEKSKLVWEDNLRLFPNSKLNFPDENLIRIFSDKYDLVPRPPAKVLDHGFGHGNNLIYFASLGYECAGCEISENLIAEVNLLFEKVGEKTELRQIVDLSIPFEDNSFDIVVSWNVLHYNGTRKAVQKVIDEFHRVIKPGGVLLLSTLHHDNAIFDRMVEIENGTYLIKQESQYDNRKGLKFFAAENENELAGMFQNYSTVKCGKVYFDLFNYNDRHATTLIYAQKTKVFV